MLPREGRGRVFAAIAGVVALALVALAIALAGDGGYEVEADFTSASQLVEGNAVKVAGAPVARSTTSS